MPETEPAPMPQGPSTSPTPGTPGSEHGRHRLPAHRPRRTTYGDVFAVVEFRPLFGSMLLSALGGELARLALTVLVFQRTQSTLLSAVTFGISYLPWVLGGPVLSTLSDRLPRHRVLIASDCARAVLVAAMAVPDTPLWGLIALLFLVSLCAPPFETARSALTADVLPGDLYAVGNSLVGIGAQVAQVAGFLLGGVLLIWISPSLALAVNASTFACSALWLSRGLVRRPAAAREDAADGSFWSGAGAGLALLLRSPRLRALIALLWSGMFFFTAPEGVASGLARELGGGAGTTSLFLSATPLGIIVGGVVLGRFCSADQRERLMAPLVAVSLLALVLTGLAPRLIADTGAASVAVVALLTLSGIGGAWGIQINVAFVQAVPSEVRGRTFGVAIAGMTAAQGAGTVLAGLAADHVAASTVVAACGALGLLAVLVPLAGLTRTRPPLEAAVAGPSGV